MSYSNNSLIIYISRYQNEMKDIKNFNNPGWIAEIEELKYDLSKGCYKLCDQNLVTSLNEIIDEIECILFKLQKNRY